MCMTNTKGIDHVIPVMLDTKNEAKFGPLHGPWQKEHIEQARQHVSYILINSKNYASGKDQTRAAWATKFSSRNLKEYGDRFQSGQTTESDEREIEDDETASEGFDVDSQYVGPDDDELDVAIGNVGEEMKDIETSELETDNVFLSLIQDFSKKRLKDTWITVLRTYRKPHLAQPPQAAYFGYAVYCHSERNRPEYIPMPQGRPPSAWLDITKPAPTPHKDVFTGTQECES
jgi:hypothetical protein